MLVPGAVNVVQLHPCADVWHSLMILPIFLLLDRTERAGAGGAWS